MNDKGMNSRPYGEKQQNFLQELKGHYVPWVKAGVCMANIGMSNEEPARRSSCLSVRVIPDTGVQIQEGL